MICGQDYVCIQAAHWALAEGNKMCGGRTSANFHASPWRREKQRARLQDFILNGEFRRSSWYFQPWNHEIMKFFHPLRCISRQSQAHHSCKTFPLSALYLSLKTRCSKSCLYTPQYLSPLHCCFLLEFCYPLRCYCAYVFFWSCILLFYRCMSFSSMSISWDQLVLVIMKSDGQRSLPKTGENRSSSRPQGSSIMEKPWC